MPLTKIQVTNDLGYSTNITASASQGATYNLNLPATDGNPGDVLTTDGTSNLSWSASGSGTVADGNYGAVTVSNGGTTWAINNGAVELADIQDIPPSTIIGRSNTLPGAPQQLTLGAGLSIAGTVLSAAGVEAPVYVVSSTQTSNFTAEVDNLYTVNVDFGAVEVTLTNITPTKNGHSVKIKRLPSATSTALVTVKTDSASTVFDARTPAPVNQITLSGADSSVTLVAITGLGYVNPTWIIC